MMTDDWFYWTLLQPLKGWIAKYNMYTKTENTNNRKYNKNGNKVYAPKMGALGQSLMSTLALLIWVNNVISVWKMEWYDMPSVSASWILWQFVTVHMKYNFAAAESITHFYTENPLKHKTHHIHVQLSGNLDLNTII